MNNMIYKILNKSITINVLVEYDFDGIILQTSIPVVDPKTEDDIKLAIENRAISELKNITQIKDIE